MNKYRVNVVEACVYTVDVEAESESDARDQAIAVMENTPCRDAFFSFCDDRDTTSVFKDPPNFKSVEEIEAGQPK